jgi:hypothetical protein
VSYERASLPSRKLHVEIEASTSLVDGDWREREREGGENEKKP